MKRLLFHKSIPLCFLLFLCSILFCVCNGLAEDAAQPAILLSAEELAYRDRAGEITIGCPVNDCPMLFRNERTGELEGITIDILNIVSEATGLAFRYQALPSGSVTYQDLQELQLDMIAGVECNDINMHSPGLVMTDAYIHAAKVFVCKKGVEFHPDSAMTIAVNSGSQTLEKVIRQQYPQFQILFCTSTEEALSALLAGKADAVLQNQYTIERILRKPIYADLRIVATASIGDSQCLACLVPTGGVERASQSEDVSLLLSILNKGIDTLDQSRVSFLIIRETSENAYEFTLWDMLYHYRYAMAGLLLCLLFILHLLWKNRILHRKRLEQAAAQRRAKELTAINAQMTEQQLLLQDALKRAEEGNRAKTTFLFNMSHDIRTPMNAILGFTEIAGRNLHDADRLKDCLEKIQASGQHLLQLINNVLDMTKIETGNTTLTEERCNLKECVEKARDLFQSEVDEKRLTLTADTSAITNEWVCCDSLRFNQILFNLLSNAVKFSKPEGHIWLSLQQRPCAIPKYACYEMRVKDNGIGMSPEFLAHIFEPFEREHTSTISHTQGTGLGMSIAKNLVDLMGGTIAVTSQPNQGTEFILQFTFTVIEQAGQPEPTDTTEAIPPMDFSGKRLLLVDDNELNMEIAQELLCDAGFIVETAENGRIAVDRVERSPAGYYDAILMDIQMPVMNGYQASRAIRGLADKSLAQIPIIALTANAFDEDKKEALANGMNAHIAKPLDIAVLCQTLGSILSR